MEVSGKQVRSWGDGKEVSREWMWKENRYYRTLWLTAATSSPINNPSPIYKLASLGLRFSTKNISGGRISRFLCNGSKLVHVREHFGPCHIPRSSAHRRDNRAHQPNRPQSHSPIPPKSKALLVGQRELCIDVHSDVPYSSIHSGSSTDTLKALSEAL
ncbi:hypothetical protein JAAARDRAFT_220397 [Jaapia argillacea MUCL 33604]|uniref:Uncharacterized protein n=1 Tax=Jaapia argillacea MUCL 33604 TaxID=933084 RepID=A0A067QL47_9AGAM|nr:hypothetical protein JAAARDRAFT_220397 [Jaapia argillacea MUCL 33604]